MEACFGGVTGGAAAVCTMTEFTLVVRDGGGLCTCACPITGTSLAPYGDLARCCCGVGVELLVLRKPNRPGDLLLFDSCERALSGVRDLDLDQKPPRSFDFDLASLPRPSETSEPTDGLRFKSVPKKPLDFD